MGGPGSGRRKGSGKGKVTKGNSQEAAANRVIAKRRARGASESSIKSYKSKLVKEFPGLKGRLVK